MKGQAALTLTIAALALGLEADAAHRHFHARAGTTFIAYPKPRNYIHTKRQPIPAYHNRILARQDASGTAAAATAEATASIYADTAQATESAGADTALAPTGGTLPTSSAASISDNASLALAVSGSAPVPSDTMVASAVETGGAGTDQADMSQTTQAPAADGSTAPDGSSNNSDVTRIDAAATTGTAAGSIVPPDSAEPTGTAVNTALVPAETSVVPDDGEGGSEASATGSADSEGDSAATDTASGDGSLPSTGSDDTAPSGNPTANPDDSTGGGSGTPTATNDALIPSSTDGGSDTTSPNSDTGGDSGTTPTGDTGNNFDSASPGETTTDTVSGSTGGFVPICSGSDDMVKKCQNCRCVNGKITGCNEVTFAQIYNTLQKPLTDDQCSGGNAGVCSCVHVEGFQTWCNTYWQSKGGPASVGRCMGGAVTPQQVKVGANGASVVI